MLIAILLLVQAGAQGTQLKELIVEASPPAFVVDAGAPAVQYTLGNRSAQAITAWQVTVRLTLSNGKAVTRGQAKDGYEPYALGKQSDAVINPAESVIGQIVLSDELGPDGKLTVIAISTTVEYAVFADRTAVGDTASINDVFRQRASDAEALAVVAAALRTGYAKGSGRAAVRGALQELNSPDQADFDNIAKRVMRKNLQRVLDSPSTPGERTPAEYLRQWLLETEAKWQAADNHCRAKPMSRVDRSPLGAPYE